MVKVCYYYLFIQKSTHSDSMAKCKSFAFVQCWFISSATIIDYFVRHSSDPLTVSDIDEDPLRAVVAAVPKSANIARPHRQIYFS